ncbi:MAG: cupredoxin domain-containing protein [Deltaproteobacteria bacterium]|nr:cupredoxin domain-containing protein [Deltaproteobacteria bacterium]
MILSKILVTIGGIALSFLVAWYFWFSKKKISRAALTGSGAQEALIVVKGGYTPDLLVVQAGKPVRLKFNRQESAVCSEMVLFPDFGKNAKLPEGETVVIEFTPQKPGEYEFSCQMGMIRGKLIVE